MVYPLFMKRSIRRLRLAWPSAWKYTTLPNIAEIELSAMTTQCLDRRIPNIEELQRQISTWETQRNQSQKAVQWQFRTEDARIKLKHLYPVVIESDIN